MNKSASEQLSGINNLIIMNGSGQCLPPYLLMNQLPTFKSAKSVFAGLSEILCPYTFDKVWRRLNGY